jgi:hypothetical protein
MTRQQVLMQPNPPDLWVVMDEATLRRTVGGPGIMKAQLEHLLEVGELPNITIQVVPFDAGAHFASGCGFIVFEFPDPLDDSVAYVENVAGALFMEDKPEITRCSMAFNHLRGAALLDGKSQALISEVVKSM